MEADGCDLPFEREFGTWTAVHVNVNGRSLLEIAAEFEAERGWKPAGGYDWLPMDGFAPARSRLLGLDSGIWPGEGLTVLLVCSNCGEEGCWPLFARVVVDGELVVWQDFAQPHRPDWDYSGVRFSFDRAVYEAEVQRAFTAH